MRLLGSLLLLLPLLAKAQRIEYKWLNMPCANMLNCDTGCSACNLPENGDGQFIGNNVGFLGVEVCPHPITSGDNALLTYGWPSVQDEQHAVLFTGIAFQPTHIDSLIIRHRAGPDGPQRLSIRYGVNESMPTGILADVSTAAEFEQRVLTDLGTVAAGPEMIYGFFSFVLQPYMGNGGSWDLDEFRIVGTPVAATSVPDLSLPTNVQPLPRFDALGRPVLERKGVRFYLDRSKRVILQ